MSPDFILERRPTTLAVYWHLDLREEGAVEPPIRVLNVSMSLCSLGIRL
jgi:hypothetical protein